MSEISKIKLGTVECSVKDTTARNLATQMATTTQSGRMSASDKIKLNSALTSGGTAKNLNVSDTLYANKITAYNASLRLTIGTGDNSGYVDITDDMYGINSDGEEVWSIDAVSGSAEFDSVAQRSDQRLKENIHDVDKSFTDKYWATENGLIHEYDWIKSGKHATGMIAQELLNYIPEAVNHNVENDTYSVNYTSATCKIIGAMFHKIKQLENEIEKLKNK